MNKTGNMREATKGPRADQQTVTGKSDVNQKSVVKFSLRLKFSLAIIGLVTFIILSIIIYFIWREDNLLKDQVFRFIKRETVHLATTTQQSLGIEELSLISAVNDLKGMYDLNNKGQKIYYIRYAFVLNDKNNIVQYFDKRKDRTIGEQLQDGIARDFSDANLKKAIMVTATPDPQDAKGTIYDFSKVVLNKLGERKIATVIIGLSDIRIRAERSELIKFFALLSLIFFVISIIGSVVLASVTIKPIKILSHGASVIGKGNFDYRIDIKTRDELGQLANEFNLMTAMIKEAKDKEIESRIMEEQLEMAKDIQEGLNPMGFYDKEGIQIKGFTRAAKGVGGDYFDYIDIDEHRIGALISDVSGKGVPASLVMVMIRTVFTSYITRKDVDCARVVRAINDSLSADFAIDKFATLFFMIYDRRTEEVSFANAGHGPLFCYRKALNKCTVSKLDGVPIGIMENAEYKQAKVKLNPGDMVIMYTDGITEMRNMEREEYGLSRVQNFMIDNNHLNANDFVEKLVADVDAFRGEASPHDDMTTLVFKRDR